LPNCPAILRVHPSQLLYPREKLSASAIDEQAQFVRELGSRGQRRRGPPQADQAADQNETEMIDIEIRRRGFAEAMPSSRVRRDDHQPSASCRLHGDTLCVSGERVSPTSIEA
jgi:hypothetical protein